MGARPGTKRWIGPGLLALALAAPVQGAIDRPGAAPQAAPGDPAQSGANEEGRLSLEDLLGRYRERRDELLAGMRGQVETLVLSLETAIQQASPARIGEARRGMVALGPEAAPLFLPAIEPGAKADEITTRRAQVVAQVLGELPTAAITSDLLELARTGSSQGKRNALAVLRRTEEPDRVGPALRDLHRSTTGDLQREVLVTLAHLGGPENEAFLGELLLAEDREVRQGALLAATSAGSTALAPELLKLLRARPAAARHVLELVAYYRACPGALDSEHAAALLALVREPRVSDADSVRLIDLLADHKPAWTLEMRRELREFIGSTSRTLEEAVLVALSRSPAPDVRARRQLLEPYDRQVELRRDSWQAYRNRADVKVRIEDYSGAIRDYTDALKYARDTLRPDASSYIGLARANMRLGKLRAAHDWLQKAPLSSPQLAALAKDPDFLELAANSRYGKVFGELDG